MRLYISLGYGMAAPKPDPKPTPGGNIKYMPFLLRTPSTINNEIIKALYGLRNTFDRFIW